jgi:hypothetical protein
MGRLNVAPAPSRALDHATKGYVDSQIAANPSAPNPSFVIGPSNTLVVPGLYLATDTNGAAIGLYYDDHNGTAGSNSDGLVAAGQTNPLTKPGLWVSKNANGDYTGLYYYDGNSAT